MMLAGLDSARIQLISRPSDSPIKVLYTMEETSNSAKVNKLTKTVAINIGCCEVYSLGGGFQYLGGDIFVIYISTMAFRPTPRQTVALISGFTVMLVQGSLYVFGTMTPYLYTYLYYQGETDLSISELSIINTLAIVATNLGIFLSNFKLVTFPHRWVSLICVLGISLCTLLISFSNRFIYFILIYGVLFGLLIGYGYLAPLKNCFDHLPNKKGLCSGACLMGFGLGAFFFNFILVELVNPDNAKSQNKLFPEQVGNNLPFALRILAIVYAGIGIIGVALAIPHKTSQAHSNPLLEVQQEAESEEDLVVKAQNYSVRAMKYTFDHKIHLLVALLASVLPYGLFVAFHFKQYGSIYIEDDHYLSLLGSIGSVGNGVFRMVLGATLDLISFKKIMLANVTVLILTCATVVFSVKNDFTYLLTVLLTFGCYGSLYSIFPTQTVRMLGRKIGPKMYYITFMGFSVGSLIQYFSHKHLVELYGEDGYLYCFIIFGCLLVVGLLLILTIDFPLHQTERILLSSSKGEGQAIMEQSSQETTIEKDTISYTVREESNHD